MSDLRNYYTNLTETTGNGGGLGGATGGGGSVSTAEVQAAIAAQTTAQQAVDDAQDAVAAAEELDDDAQNAAQDLLIAAQQQLSDANAMLAAANEAAIADLPTNQDLADAVTAIQSAQADVDAAQDLAADAEESDDDAKNDAQDLLIAANKTLADANALGLSLVAAVAHSGAPQDLRLDELEAAIALVDAYDDTAITAAAQAAQDAADANGEEIALLNTAVQDGATIRDNADNALDTRVAAVEALLPDDDTPLVQAIADNAAALAAEISDTDADVATLLGQTAANLTATQTNQAAAVANATNITQEAQDRAADDAAEATARADADSALDIRVEALETSGLSEEFTVADVLPTATALGVGEAGGVVLSDAAFKVAEFSASSQGITTLAIPNNTTKTVYLIGQDPNDVRTLLGIILTLTNTDGVLSSIIDGQVSRTYTTVNFPNYETVQYGDLFTGGNPTTSSVTQAQLDFIFTGLGSEPASVDYVDTQDAALQSSIDAIDVLNTGYTADITALQNASANFIDNSTDQTVGGVKTFTSSVLIPSTLATDGGTTSASKDYVDGLVATANSAIGQVANDLTTEASNRTSADTALDTRLVALEGVDIAAIVADISANMAEITANDGDINTILSSVSVNTTATAANAAALIVNANAIAQESTDRANADNAEATARANADTALQSNIDSEATTRASADTALQAALDAEIAETNTEQDAQDVLLAKLLDRIKTAQSGEITTTAAAGALTVANNAADTGNFNPAHAGEYLIEASGLWGYNNTTTDIFIDLVEVLNGATIVKQRLRQEPKDIGGTGTGGTDQRHNFKIREVVTLAPADNARYFVRFFSGSDGILSMVDSVLLTINWWSD